MYVYKGRGYCVPLDDDLAYDLVCVYNESQGTDYEDIDGLDDVMELGDWCSVDNVESAYLEGEHSEGDAGVLVLRDGYGNPDLLVSLCQEIGIDARSYYGDFEVNCWE